MTDKEDRVDKLISQMTLGSFLFTYLGAIAAAATVLSAILSSPLSTECKLAIIFLVLLIGYISFLEIRINRIKKDLERLKEENIEIKDNIKR